MDTDHIDIVEARLDDPAHARALLSVLDAYAADPMGAGRPLSPAVRERLIPALRAVPGAWQLLAFAGDEPIGAAVCFTGFSTFRALPLTNIHDFAVLAPWRRRGVGRRLLGVVEAEARRRGHCKLTLEVRDDNPGAAALYRGLGFGAGEGDGRAVQYLFMEKRLVSSS
jgi:ribosomal protein S18 acetylase RimI-like enzyme